MATEKTKKRRELLTKKPFYRINADVGERPELPVYDIGEQVEKLDKLAYDIVTQEDFLRELDPAAHAINDHEIYQNWMQNDADGLYYETQWERHAFAYQQEILEDRLVRLTGNDIQFDLSERTENENNRESYYKFKSLWAKKSMERAWYEVAKSTLATGDAAFIGIIDKKKFYWKVLSFLKGDKLYPHYDRLTGRLNVFAREYKEYGDDGQSHRFVDVWDDIYYYRFIEDSAATDKGGDESNKNKVNYVGDFVISGFVLEDAAEHGFDTIPVAYMRKDSGPCWSNSQDSIEHYELAFSRLAQSNSAFGLPILALTNGQGGKKIEELTMGDMSYAAKIFLIPSEGKAEFLQRQDASDAYKAQLDELKRKIYEQSMVVKAPELKSGDTPAAAIKLLYSDSYNKGMNETQEFDGCIDDMVHIFSWGAGLESENRLEFINLPLSHWIIVFIPVSENELTTILATGVQNGFCSKQTASEKFPYATPQEYTRCLQEKHDEQMTDLLLQESKLEIQTEATIEQAEALAKINGTATTSTSSSSSTTDTSSSQKKDARKVQIRKGSGSSGGKRGRPNMSGTTWNDSRNAVNPLTGKAYSKWQKWDTMH